jgi:hypothetical protein
MRWWRPGCVGCFAVALISILALGGCAARFLQSTWREPELPVEQFLQKQLEVLPPGWTLGKSQIETDTDFTWARWVVTANFRYKKGLHSAGEEIHVFSNSLAARIILRPSPPSVSAGKGYIPRGWTYRPPHANRFEFGCSGGDGLSQPEGCSLILRYEEYIVVFATPIGSHMTLDDLQRVLQAIDTEMSDYLERSTLRPGPRLVPARWDTSERTELL